MTGAVEPSDDDAGSGAGCVSRAVPRPAGAPSTSPARRVLVTGAGGKTGRAVLAALVARGVEVRGLVRDGRAAAGVVEAAGRPDAGVVGDQREPDEVARALDGCDAVYAIAPNMSPHEVAMAEALLAAVERQGITRVVYHSVVDPDEPAMPHHADKAEVERLLSGTDGLAWTVLRPNAYAQNLAGYLDGMRAGVIEVPYATDAVSAFVDLRDVAEVAARVLIAGSEVGARLELSGPQLVSTDDVARVAARLLGHPVRARRVSPEAWAAANAHLDAETRSRLTAMFRHYDRVGSPGDPSTLRRLLGREPGRARDVLVRLLGADPDGMSVRP